MNCNISINDSWIKMDIVGDISISYPIFGDEDKRNEKIASFFSDLKKALDGNRISTLR